ncbi:hypothetical protein ABF173_001698 [Flavobacterium psychrophilum]|nr:hypothetical protein [Flavobacterium psychrophilum]SNB07028.1 conserved hypothetical protein [Flavobacterium psychrophilum]
MKNKKGYPELHKYTRYATFSHRNQNSMKLEQWVLFIDMLGYREINGEINNDKYANDFLDFMKSNEKIFNDQNNPEIKNLYQSESFDLYKYYEIQTTFVSDSLIINFKPKEFEELLSEQIRMMHSANTLFIIMNRLQGYIYNCLKEHGILVRGGISNKYCLIRDNYAVGDGVIDAYLNESTRAVNPRIVLSQNITDNKQFISAFNFISKQIYNRDTFLRVDDDGVYYLDYLKYNIRIVSTTMLGNLDALKTVNGFLAVHRDVIKQKIIDIDQKINIESEEGKLKVLNKIKSKIIWLKNYHNESAKEAIPELEI